jgi:TRAP-type C4-dicarboxylate transport system permease small subunit
MENWNDDTILNSLAGMKRAEPSPFLFTRIEARLQKATQLTTTQLRVATAALIILLAVNVWAISSRQTTGNESTSGLTSIQAY